MAQARRARKRNWQTCTAPLRPRRTGTDSVDANARCQRSETGSYIWNDPVDDRETDRIVRGGRERGSMKKRKTKSTKSTLDSMQEIGRKYGVKVTDMSERGVRGIGFLGGVSRQDQEAGARDHSPTVGGRGTGTMSEIGMLRQLDMAHLQRKSLRIRFRYGHGRRTRTDFCRS